MAERRIYNALGLMSGTSLDGIDVAVIKTDGFSVISFGPFESRSYSSEFRVRLRAELGNKILPQALEEDLTWLHANLVKSLFATSGLSSSEIDVIGFHGHTIHHEPKSRFTLQIGDGALLSELLGCTVVNNFRSADVAAGGEGAPFAPVYHQALASDFGEPVAVINIGGVANVSFISQDCLMGFDTGPGNAPIDDIVKQRTGSDFDEGGALARQGKIDNNILVNLLDHSYFGQTPPKSLDRNGFDFSWTNELSVEDAAATLVAFTTEAIARSIQFFPEPVQRFLMTGGGRHNYFMMSELERRVGGCVLPVESVGWNGDAIEAQAFAFLAVRSLLNLPLSFPSTTGVSQELTGGDIHPH
jgi:anhydro-N-acetylmuramic acid kinase